MIASPPVAPACVLFDLDGTLLDTAPDLANALNRLRLEQELPALPFARIFFVGWVAGLDWHSNNSALPLHVPFASRLAPTGGDWVLSFSVKH